MPHPPYQTNGTYWNAVGSLGKQPVFVLASFTEGAATRDMLSQIRSVVPRTCLQCLAISSLAGIDFPRIPILCTECEATGDFFCSHPVDSLQLLSQFPRHAVPRLVPRDKLHPADAYAAKAKQFWHMDECDAKASSS